MVTRQIFSIIIALVLVFVVEIVDMGKGYYLADPSKEGKVFVESLCKAIKAYFKETEDYGLNAFIYNHDGSKRAVAKDLPNEYNSVKGRYFEVSLFTKEFIIENNFHVEKLSPLLSEDYYNYFDDYDFINEKIIESIYFKKYKNLEYSNNTNYNRSCKIFVIVYYLKSHFADIVITDSDDLVWESHHIKFKNILMKIPVEL